MEITSLGHKAPVLRDLPSRLLSRTATLVGRVVSEVFAAEGARRHQFAALATLDAFGSSSQAELCRRTDIDRSDMNAIVNTLEAEGLVSRIPDPSDRRQNIVGLTAAGRRRLDRLKARLVEAQNRALAPLKNMERRELIRLLQLIHDHLAAPPPD